MEIGNWNEDKNYYLNLDRKIFLGFDKSKLSDYEKRRMIYDYLCSTLTYDHDLLAKVVENSKNIGKHLRNPYLEVMDVLTKQKGICNAIAQV